MAIVHLGKVKTNIMIGTPSFFIEEVEVLDDLMFATGRGTMANMKVTLTVTAVSPVAVTVGYMVINKDNRLLSYKGVFTMAKCDSISEQLTRVLRCL